MVRSAGRLPVLLLLLTALARAHEDPREQLARVEARLDASDLGALLARSALQRRLGELEEARGSVAAALRLAPRSARAHLEHAEVLTAAQDHAGAEAAASASLALLRSVRALALRCQARAAVGELAYAAPDCVEAQARRPTVEASRQAAHLLVQLGQVREAAELLERALAALGGPVALREPLVAARVRLGEYDAALAVIDALLPTLPVAADWRLRRAEVLERAGRTKEAARERRAALAQLDELLSERATDLRRLARAEALLGLGRREEALVELRQIRSSVATEPRLAALNARALR